MELLELMKSRHSVRQYKETLLSDDIKDAINNLIKKINEENDLNFQVVYDEPKCFDSFMAHYGKFSGVTNYIALISKPKNDVVVGYFGEEIVLMLQSLGLNSCFVALTHGKPKAKINKKEKLYCIIAFGYGITNGVSHKIKKIEEVSNYTPNMPNWFKEGVEAALLAPTAVNQQKFYFRFSEGKVNLIRKKGFYSKLDLGIVKYHFEKITNVTCEY